MVRSKQKLSNTLAEMVPHSAPSVVNQILSLSEEISSIYEAKRKFDEDRILPNDWLMQDEKFANTIKELDKQIKLSRARISKAKAKLKNPNEVRDGGGNRLRKKIREEEEYKIQLTQKIMHLKMSV